MTSRLMGVCITGRTNPRAELVLKPSRLVLLKLRWSHPKWLFAMSTRAIYVTRLTDSTKALGTTVGLLLVAVFDSDLNPAFLGIEGTITVLALERKGPTTFTIIKFRQGIERLHPFIYTYNTRILYLPHPPLYGSFVQQLGPLGYIQMTRVQVLHDLRIVRIAASTTPRHGVNADASSARSTILVSQLFQRRQIASRRAVNSCRRFCE